MNNFKNYYNLPVVPTLEMIMEVHKRFDSPYDKELIWGPVFREYLLHDPATNDNDLSDIHRNALIPSDIGALLANALGASLIVHHQYTEYQGPLRHTIANPEFEITLYHSGNKNGHFDFAYPNDINGEKARKHNDSYESVYMGADNLGNHIVKPRNSILYNANENIYDQQERKKRVIAHVQNALRDSIDTELKNESSYRPRRKF